ncbi:uncharacterized protein LOC107046391 [Diachasma alloeum]|uniref:uncharacterized protein LOC107046391 n=1 Tax=Diachasma alloeum TaxID=454923 RepID=UPI0007384C24|nr:uncharacterized protein LOC107046391 [Diachasma alloeum]
MDDTTTESIRFIQTELIPEMVHNRCFCEPGSREFVEFESASVTPLITSQVNENRELYRARVIIRFSGDAKPFNVIIKLLTITCQEDGCAYGCFLNEEMFYNKMTGMYKLDIYPKCYAADMGRYGRPVIVLEDLEAIGYHHVSSKLDGDHLKLLLEAIARFHARSIDLKHKEFSILREFYAQLTQVGDDRDNYSAKIDRVLENLTTIESEYAEKFRKDLVGTEIRRDPNGSPFFTICHGSLNLNHSLFSYEGEKPISVKILGWNRMAYTCPTVDLESILHEAQLEGNCITEIRKNFNEYFNALFGASTALEDESLRKFLLAFFSLLVFPPISESRDDERELINFLNSHK